MKDRGKLVAWKCKATGEIKSGKISVLDEADMMQLIKDGKMSSDQVVVRWVNPTTKSIIKLKVKVQDLAFIGYYD